MAELHFDFRDIFRAGRYGLGVKPLAIHFLGLALAYVIYEILVYASLFVTGGGAAVQFWNTYALLPVCPLVNDAFEDVTIGAMWLGIFIFFVCFFLTSTMVSKITIQQLRGDHFFSMKESWYFAQQHWKAVFGTLVGLIIVLILLAFTPIVVGLLGKLPTVGRVLLMVASLFTPFAFFIGLLMAYFLVILGVSLFFAPSVVAAVDSDAFETAYQHLSMVWNQPWRVLIYETLLFGVKVICVSIWAIFCLIGFALAILPIYFLLSTDMQHIMWNADRWLGGAIDKLAALPYIDLLKVFDIGLEPTTFPITLHIAAIFMTLALLFIAGLIIAYLFSIASAGNTLIYTLLRRRVDGENLLEVEEEAGDALLPQTENQSDAEEKAQ